MKPIPESDYEKFIATVKRIEECWLDIKKAKLEKEMSNISVISIIERLLPTEQKKEWIKIVRKSYILYLVFFCYVIHVCGCTV